MNRNNARDIRFDQKLYSLELHLHIESCFFLLPFFFLSFLFSPFFPEAFPKGSLERKKLPSVRVFAESD
jgi:hypothetical protein